MIFYTDKFYYNSVEKIQIGLVSDKNIKHFTCELVLLLGETLSGKNTANIPFLFQYMYRAFFIILQNKQQMHNYN